MVLIVIVLTAGVWRTMCQGIYVCIKSCRYSLILFFPHIKAKNICFLTFFCICKSAFRWTYWPFEHQNQVQNKVGPAEEKTCKINSYPNRCVSSIHLHFLFTVLSSPMIFLTCSLNKLSTMPLRCFHLIVRHYKSSAASNHRINAGFVWKYPCDPLWRFPCCL